jgi:hypothetical protein
LPNPLDKYNEAFKQLQLERRLQVIVGAAAPNPEEEPIKSIKNTTHHQLLSHLQLLHPQFQHLVMRDTSLGRKRRRRM